MAKPNGTDPPDMDFPGMDFPGMAFPGMDNPMVKPFLDYWSRFARESTGTAWQAMPTPMSLVNPASFFRDWERRWMDALSDSFDAYLRSPQFLEWMRHNSDLIVKSKQQSDNVAKEFARNAGIPTASDISGLYERLHSFEDNLIRRIDKELLQRPAAGDPPSGSRTNGDLTARLDRFEETLRSTKNGGEWRRRLDQGVEDLSERMDQLERTVMSALERIERRLGGVGDNLATPSSRRVAQNPRRSNPGSRAKTPAPRSRSKARATESRKTGRTQKPAK